mmetsp:Transcript_56805/g.128744  ORF Transcript_56805/g.128744 Transcript_56805/m.128744 type:complete len:213 (-) Transcript_56805:125-763(-)
MHVHAFGKEKGARARSSLTEFQSSVWAARQQVTRRTRAATPRRAPTARSDDLLSSMPALRAAWIPSFQSEAIPKALTHSARSDAADSLLPGSTPMPSAKRRASASATAAALSSGPMATSSADAGASSALASGGAPSEASPSAGAGSDPELRSNIGGRSWPHRGALRGDTIGLASVFPMGFLVAAGGGGGAFKNPSGMALTPRGFSERSIFWP